jgi:hypothetical protein
VRCQSAQNPPARSGASWRVSPSDASSPRTPGDGWGWWSGVEASEPRLRLTLPPPRHGCVSQVASAAPACWLSPCGSDKLVGTRGTETRANGNLIVVQLLTILPAFKKTEVCNHIHESPPLHTVRCYQPFQKRFLFVKYYT